MKLLIVLALVAFASARPDGEFYDSKFDEIDIDQVTSNDRLLLNYVNCALGSGKCTSEGKEINGLIPGAVQDKCAKCTDKQKTIVAKCLKAIKAKFPEEYKKLLAIHDPEGKHEPELLEFVEKHSQ